MWRCRTVRWRQRRRLCRRTAWLLERRHTPLLEGDLGKLLEAVGRHRTQTLAQVLFLAVVERFCGRKHGGTWISSLLSGAGRPLDAKRGRQVRMAFARDKVALFEVA